MTTMPPRFSIGQCAALACLLEVTAPKPGNVHRGADFEDMSYVDFAASAVAIMPAMEAAAAAPLGQTVLDAVRATRETVSKNTNLGTVLLLAPLAMVPREVPLDHGSVKDVLEQRTAEDADLVYQAIRLAQPGGLGTVSQGDVSDPPPRDLLAAMRLAAERDLVSRQYANGFAEVFDVVAPKLWQGIGRDWSLPVAIVHAQMQLMSEYPDSLIARKCGEEVARQAADRAAAVLAAGQPGETAYQQALAEFDFWLRSDEHRRNPGTTADLIAAGLFVLLREGMIEDVTR